MKRWVRANKLGLSPPIEVLAVLLKEAGIPSALISLSPMGDGQINENLPSPLATHAILLVTIDGTEHWIDTTASLAGWDFLDAENNLIVRRARRGLNQLPQACQQRRDRRRNSRLKWIGYDANWPRRKWIPIF